MCCYHNSQDNSGLELLSLLCPSVWGSSSRRPGCCDGRGLGAHLVVPLGVVASSKVVMWAQMAAGAPATPFSFQPEEEVTSPFLWGQFRKVSPHLAFLLVFFKRFCFLFLEREGRKRETSMCGCLWRAPHWGPGPQPRHVPDWESNQRPFGLQAGIQPTELHQPGLRCEVLSHRVPHHG